ncbi:MAG: amino acid ABC transporter permease [Halodesulfurarchaeum sp.]
MSGVQEDYRTPGIDVSIKGGISLVPYLLFWGWLLSRWINDFLLPPGVGVPAGTPYVAPSSVSSIWEPLGFAVSYLPSLANGVWTTLVLTFASIVLGFFIAVPISVARVYGRASAWGSLLFTELIRGTPLLAQLFVLYYGLQLSSWIRELPLVGEGIVPGQAFWVAIIGFTINSAAYQAEYIRSALLSVESGQLQAGRAIGLSRIGAIYHVVLPQALRFAIPGWSNELVYLIKYSSLAAFITVPELFEVGRQIAADNFAYTAIFTLVGLFYLAIIITTSNVMGVIERRVQIPGLGSSTDR